MQVFGELPGTLADSCSWPALQAVKLVVCGERWSGGLERRPGQQWCCRLSERNYRLWVAPTRGIVAEKD